MTGAQRGRPSRRDVLRWSLGGAAAAATGAACSGERAEPATPRPSTPAAASWHSDVPPSRRKLVVVELTGGNDGLTVMPPMDDGAYHDARPTLAVDPATLVDLGDGYGLHPSFSTLHERGLTLLAGVGDLDPSLSHFEMLSRWWAGRPGMSKGIETGFFGRLCDRLAAGSGIAGVSIGVTASPAMASANGTTVGMSDGRALEFLAESPAPARAAFRQTLSELGGAGATAGPLGTLYGSGVRTVLDLDGAVAAMPQMSPAYAEVAGPGAHFAAEMGLASRLLQSDLGVQVVYVTAGQAMFDTHASHAEGHAAAWDRLLPGIEVFCADLERLGMTEEVLIATTSEFGRRLKESNGGLDHGSASCALLMGPTPPGVVGEHPSLTELDDSGNLVPTVSFDRYLATLSAWLDVDPSAVLADSAEPITELLPR